LSEPVRKFADLEDFLAWERQQEERYEYLDGVVIMMAGGSLDHTRIAENFKAELRERLRNSGCEVFGSDAKVVLAGRLIYPDISVTCAQNIDGRSDIVPEPMLVIEVVSATSRERDIRVKKLRAFQTPSVRHYAVVEQESAYVDLFRRQGETWINIPVSGLEGSVPLDAFGISVPLAAIYRGVNLPAQLD
jgi:Uma2 family endonuclease